MVSLIMKPKLLHTTPEYQPKFKRWAQQENALRAMYGREGFALFMDMRTGKSKTILDEFCQDEMDAAVKNLLVVAPAGVYRTWQTAAADHINDPTGRIHVGIWQANALAAEERAFERFMKYAGPRILLVNVEALSGVMRAREVCRTFLQSAPSTMVIDESTTLKNGKAARTKFCLQMARFAKKRRILSGLPSPQSPLDLHSQLDFLGVMQLEGYERFLARYAITEKKPYGPGGRLIDTVVGYKNLDDLQARMRPHSFRVRLAECYDLPEKMYIRRDVEMTDEQRRAYREMKEFAIAELKNAERVTATIVLTQMLRLHQILSGHAKSDDGNVVDIPENKTAEMLDILENHAGKAIIWASYDADIHKITAALHDVYGVGSVARFWGGNRATREDEEQSFKNDPACRFMVATASAGGRGRTWDIADLMIYYSNTFSLEHRMQSEERNQAVGKTTSVGVFDLVVRGSIEEKVLAALRTKMNLSDAITGDNFREWIV